MNCLTLINKTVDQKSSTDFDSGLCCQHRPGCDSSPWFCSDLPPCRSSCALRQGADSCLWQQPTGSASWGLSDSLHKYWDQSKNEGSMGWALERFIPQFSYLQYSVCPLHAVLKDLLPRNSWSQVSSGLVSGAGACRLSEANLQCSCSSIQHSSLSGQFSFESKDTVLEGSRE